MPNTESETIKEDNVKFMENFLDNPFLSNEKFKESSYKDNIKLIDEKIEKMQKY
jgi:hypothetical protein